MFMDLLKVDFLPIMNGIFITDVIIILLTIAGFFGSKYLKKYYREYGITAVLLDVLIIAIGFIIARVLYPMIFSTWSIWKFIALLLVIQICHDVLFYLFFRSIDYGKYKLIDMFKDYANEVSAGAIIGDSIMMILSALIAYGLTTVSTTTNVYVFIIILYIALFAASCV